jgi:hypothetical protein
MRILRSQQVWIHTYFITDCTFLPDHYAREIRRKMEAILDELGIVFGIHFFSPNEGGLVIVLACIPLPETMQQIEGRLSEIIKPIPARPRRAAVRIEAPMARPAARRR